MEEKEYHVTVMSIDPDDHEGREQGDDHQKYGLKVMAKSEAYAIDKATTKFEQDYAGLPIYWVRA